MFTRVAALTVSAAATIALLSGCGRQVAIAPPPDPPASCADLIEALPDSLDGAGRRPTSPESIATAAWGEPPIVLRCGVPRPDALDSTAVLFDVDGIPWFPEELQAGVVFTTVIPVGTGLVTADDATGGAAADSAYIEVIVPATYPSPGALLAGLVPALAQSDTSS